MFIPLSKPIYDVPDGELSERHIKSYVDNSDDCPIINCEVVDVPISENAKSLPKPDDTELSRQQELGIPLKQVNAYGGELRPTEFDESAAYEKLQETLNPKNE